MRTSDEIQQYLITTIDDIGVNGITSKQLHAVVSQWLSETGDSISENSLWNHMKRLIDSGRAVKYRAAANAPNTYISSKYKQSESTEPMETPPALNGIDAEIPPDKPPKKIGSDPLSQRELILIHSEAIMILRDMPNAERFKPVEDTIFSGMKSLILQS